MSYGPIGYGSNSSSSYNSTYNRYGAYGSRPAYHQPIETEEERQYQGDRRRGICGGVLVAPALALPLHRSIFKCLTSHEMAIILRKLAEVDDTLSPESLSFSEYTARALLQEGNVDLLCAALRRRKTLRTLAFRQVNLSEDHFGQLVAAICSSGVTRVTFDNCRLAEEHFAEAVRHLNARQCPLKHLGVTQNALSANAALSLGDLVGRTTIEALLATNCRLSDASLGALLQRCLLGRHLRYLSVAGNPQLQSMSYEGAAESTSLTRVHSGTTLLPVSVRRALRRNFRASEACRRACRVVLMSGRYAEGVGAQLARYLWSTRGHPEWHQVREGERRSHSGSKRLKRSAREEDLAGMSPFKHIIEYGAQRQHQQVEDPQEMEVVLQDDSQEQDDDYQGTKPMEFEINDIYGDL